MNPDGQAVVVRATQVAQIYPALRHFVRQNSRWTNPAMPNTWFEEQRRAIAEREKEVDELKSRLMPNHAMQLAEEQAAQIRLE